VPLDNSGRVDERGVAEDRVDQFVALQVIKVWVATVPAQITLVTKSHAISFAKEKEKKASI
jgi:hypothetical protein